MNIRDSYLESSARLNLPFYHNESLLEIHKVQPRYTLPFLELKTNRKTDENQVTILFQLYKIPIIMMTKYDIIEQLSRLNSEKLPDQRVRG